LLLPATPQLQGRRLPDLLPLALQRLLNEASELSSNCFVQMLQIFVNPLTQGRELFEISLLQLFEIEVNGL
jgi:hypothetical protein